MIFEPTIRYHPPGKDDSFVSRWPFSKSFTNFAMSLGSSLAQNHEGKTGKLAMELDGFFL